MSQSQKEVLAALAKTVQEIDEVLAKSKWEPWMSSDGSTNPMKKNEEPSDGNQGPDKIEDKAAGMEQEDGKERADEAGSAPAAPAPEGAPEAGAEEAEMKQAVSSMKSDHLMMMMEMISEELQSRDQESSPSQEAAQPAPAATAPEAAEKSLKEDYAKMHKSLEQATERINVLEKTMKDAQKPVQKVEKKQVLTKTAAMSSSGNVLEKSAPAVAKSNRLNKSETMEFLLNQVRQGNKLVGSDMIAEINLARDDEMLHQMQDNIVKRGVNLPK